MIRDRWAMDAVDGVVRVRRRAASRGGTGNANSVVTFGEEGDDLVESGRLGGLGVGEEIESVRWFDTSRSWSPSARSTRSTPSTSPTRPTRGWSGG